MNLFPYLKLGPTEIANSLRTLTYLRRGLGGPYISVMSCASGLAGGSGYSDTYSDLYEGDDFDPADLSCYCAAVDGGPYSDPAYDAAPWYDATRPESADFLGFIASDIRLQPVLARTLTARSFGGGDIGPPIGKPRIIEVTGQMFAASAAGMAYGERWVSRALAGTVAGCVVDDLTVLPACMATTETFGYLSLPGLTGSYSSTPDAAALDITGDLELVIEASLDAWATGSGTQALIAKWLTTGNQRSYLLRLSATGFPELLMSANGTTVLTHTSTAATGFTPGTQHWIKATIDVDNGSSQRVVKFYTSSDGVTFTQLGSTLTVAGATSIFASTSVLELGTESSGANSPTSGRVYRAFVRNGIGGTAVASPDFRYVTAMPYAEGANTWSLAGSASLSPYVLVDGTAALRDLANVGLTDGPVFSGVVRDETQVQNVAFQFAAGESYLRRVTAAEVGVDLATAASTCVELDATPPVLVNHASVLRINAGAAYLDGLTIKAYDGGCPAVGSPEFLLETVNLPPYTQLLIDASKRIVQARTAAGVVESGLQYLDFDGVFRWMLADSGARMCVCVTTAGATGLTGATLDIDTVENEA